MTFNVSRRTILASCGAALAAPAGAWSAPRPSRLYRDAVVIDGNLVADCLNGDAIVDDATAAKVKASGLTAMKQTLGSSSFNFAETTQDLDHLESAIAKNVTLFTKVLNAADIDGAKRSNRVGIIFSFEAASMHEGRLNNIDHFRTRGVRVMGLSYNVASPFGTGVLVKEKNGLTPLGREAVTRMNALGVSVDLSHSDEPTSFQALATSKRPVLITHAGCAAVHPHPRNKSDALLKAVADKGGVVGIYDLSYLGNYPANPTLDIYLRHLTHALEVCGEDHVGIGSDTTFLAFDVSPASMAEWNKDEAQRKAAGVSAPEEGPPPYVQGLNGPDRWEVIASELVRRRYSSGAIDKILGLNFKRAFAETW